MKKMVRFTKKSFAALLTALTLVFASTSCTAVQVSSGISVNQDQTGSRTITGSIAKNDNNNDNYGSAYYYIKLHGEALQQYLQGVYAEKVPGSESWLTITVDDSGADWELVNLTFDYSSLEDYNTKLASLAYDTTVTTFVAPELTIAEDGTVSYTESTGCLTAIFKSIQNTIMADDTVFDFNSTKDGVALNDGTADLQSLTDSGVELMKPEFGSSLIMTVGTGEPVAVEAVDGNYVFTGNISGAAAPAEEHVTTNVLKYGFDGDITNAGTAAENDLTYGPESTAGGPVFEEGIDGQGIKLDGATYLASPNKTYEYDEMTLSFYYKMNEYVQTDSGANMITVPAGLGALGGGVIDIEFIKDGDAEGVQLLSKMNSSDWQTQDKLYSDNFFVDTKLNEWHNYTLVYQNEYDEFGNINDAFVYMYIDGQLATKSRLSVAAGLPYTLGMFDDGSNGEANGGFNIGGYLEAGIVKRASNGVLDNLLVFDGALTPEEVNELCYTVAVEKPFDPNATEEPAEEAAETETVTEETKEGGNNIGTIAGVALAIGVCTGIGVYSSKKKK